MSSLSCDRTAESPLLRAATNEPSRWQAVVEAMPTAERPAAPEPVVKAKSTEVRAVT